MINQLIKICSLKTIPYSLKYSYFMKPKLYSSKFISSFNTSQGYQFSNIKSKQPLKSLYEKLINEGSKLNSPTIIKSLHILTFKNTQAQNIRIKDQELEFLLDKIIGQSVMQLSQADLTLLLQSLSQFKKYRRYDKNVQIYRIIAKRLNSISSLKLQLAKFSYRTLHILQKLHFPTALIRKYLQHICNKIQEKMYMKSEDRITSVDGLRVFIIMSEAKYTPVRMLNTFYECIIANNLYTSPLQLSYLYYMLNNIQKVMKGKYNYFASKIQIYDTLFNPYAQLPSEEQKNIVKQKDPNLPQQSNNQPKQQKQYYKKQQQLVGEQVTSLLTKMKKKFMLINIKESLEKLYGFQHAPLRPAIALMLVDIQELTPRFFDMIKNNYEQMLPHEFIRLFSTVLTSIYYKKNVQVSEMKNIYIKYCKKMWMHLGIGDQLMLIQVSSKYINTKQITQNQEYFLLTEQNIVKLLQNKKRINSEQFKIIQQVLRKHIKGERHPEILKVIQKIIDDQPHQDN